MANPTPPSNTIALTTTLSAIESKVRRLTRSPSTAQLSQAELDNYINTSVIYDFPEHLRTFNLRTTFSFYTNPGQDVYNTDIASFAGNTTNALVNFQNKYLTIHPPIYMAGYQSFYSQSQEQFFGIYPMTNNVASIGVTGNGLTNQFTGVINSQQSIVPPGTTQNISLIQGQVIFSSADANGLGLILQDVPVVDAATGYKTNIGNLYDPNSAAYQAAVQTPPTVVIPTNTINYLTGVFSISFTAAPGSGIPINSQSIPTTRTIPQAMLYYSNTFTIRPVPDQPYKINFEVYARPTALLSASQSPELEEYWQYIAYLAAKKIFEDRMDLDSVQLIMPELKKQEALCQRRTLVQYTNERTATIYTEQTSYGGQGGWGWGNGGG